MNVLMLTQYYPPEFGGSAVYMERIARMLVDAGHSVTVLTSMPNYPEGVIPPEYRGKLFCSEMRDGAQIRRVWVITSPNKRIRARLANQISFMLMTALRGTFLPRPDVILVESHPLFVAITGGWLRRVKRRPVVLNVSDLWPASAVAVGALREDSFLVRAAERVERWAYRDAAHVIAMTEGIRQGVIKIIPADSVTLIQNAVDLSRFRPDLDAEGAEMCRRYGLENEFVIAHIGNMSLAHDFELIMDVVAALPEYKFLFAGSGAQVDYVNDQIQKHSLRNVVLTGILPHTDMPAIWAATDVCLIAFKDHELFEGALPTKMFEAMATGTPVVAATRGEAQVVLESTGAGVATRMGDREAMIAAIRHLANSAEARQQMAAAGCAYADQHLSPERIKRQFLHIFEKVTGSPAEQ